MTGPNSHMEIFSLAIKRRASERHPVLVTVQTADSEGTERVHGKAMAVTGCPCQPLFIGGLKLAVYRSDLTVTIDIDQRAVQAVAAPIRWSFHDADVGRNGALTAE
jgi:hypothetical protein